jgi:6-phosphogluconolactonase
VPELALEISNPGFIVIHPNKKFIYTTTSGMSDSKNGGVAALKINDDGTLTFINKQSSEGINPCHVNIDTTGKCLMTVNYSSGSVASYKINKDGSLSKAVSIHQHNGAVPNSSRQKEPHPHSIIPAPVDNFAYVPDLGLDKIMIYKIKPEQATLTEDGFTKIPGDNMGPRHMKWDKSGKYMYVLNELKPIITVFKTGKESGTLEYITDLSTLPADMDTKDMYGSEIRIHPNGKFVYAAMRDTGDKKRDLIAVFNTLENDNPGNLIEMPSAEVSVPRNFNIDPSGKWMLVAGMNSHDIAIFSIDEKTGKLTFTGKKIPFNGSPICIEFLDK